MGDHKVIGGERCPIVDTWWQTETGGVMITPLPGAVATKPGSCDPALSRYRRGHPRRPGQRAARQHRRPAGRPQALARDAPRHLRRPPTRRIDDVLKIPPMKAKVMSAVENFIKSGPFSKFNSDLQMRP